MNYEEALNFIHSVSWKGSRPGLERTQQLLCLMGNPEKKLKYVHIAGTNGKGSTASMTANILKKEGYKVGLYTSPYIFTFNERMRVNGENITDSELCEICEFVKPKAEKMIDSPTEFELVTCIAFEYFYRKRCDIVVLEVGMGGELDSTNVIDSPEVAVITNIGLDHTEFLGDTVEKIAETKSKIIKENSVAVLYPSAEGVERVIKERCDTVKADLKIADFDKAVLKSASLSGQIFDYKDFKNIKLSLLGKHQIKNTVTVFTVIEALRSKGWKITDKSIREGIETVRWQGRFELLSENPVFIVDGGHNPQCASALFENVKDYLGEKKLVILTGVLADKDYDSMYKDMATLASEFVSVTVPNPRALSSEDLATYLKQFSKPVTSAESIADGVAIAKEKAGENGAVLAYGSLYMVSDIEKAVLDNGGI